MHVLYAGLLAVMWAVWASPAALADIGVGVGGGPVTMRGAGLPGQSYTLTPFQIVNTGTEPARYTISIQRLSAGDEQDVPGDWIRFADNGFLLGPQQSLQVGVTLELPDQAAPGAYLTNIIASAGPPDQPVGGASLGAAAATRLVFGVAELPPTARGPFGIALPWPLPEWLPWALAGGGGFAATLLILRWLGYGVRLERKP